MDDLTLESLAELRDGLHVFTDFVLPEFVPIDGEADLPARRVVLTNLTNFTMPFIRYDQGDLAEVVEEPCGCGLIFPRIRLVYARASDVVTLPNGGTVSALRLGGPLWDAPGVEAFKIVQDSASRLVVNVVRQDRCDETRIRAAAAAVTTFLPGMRVDLEFVGCIAPNPSGKFTHIQALASPPRDAEPSALLGDRRAP